MTSEKRILAARANGALSRGPKTPEGKARSSRNATRHGLLSKCVLLRNENRGAFQSLFDCYVERFGPLDDVEVGLIEEMVAAHWRLRRAMAIEAHMIDVDMDSRQSGAELDRLTIAFGELSCSPKLNVLHRYQTRLHLMHSRAIRDLAIMRHALTMPNEPSKPCVSTKTLEIPAAGEPTPPPIEPSSADPKASGDPGSPS